MKYLVKFNESKKEIDIDDIVSYIKLVFAEFGDDSKYNLEYSEYSAAIPNRRRIEPDKANTILLIYLHTPASVINKNNNIQGFINDVNTLAEFYSDIDVCMKRINDEYPIVEFVLEYQVEEDDNYPGVFSELLCIKCRINIKN